MLRNDLTAKIVMSQVSVMIFAPLNALRAARKVKRTSYREHSSGSRCQDSILEDVFFPETGKLDLPKVLSMR